MSKNLLGITLGRVALNIPDRVNHGERNICLLPLAWFKRIAWCFSAIITIWLASGCEPDYSFRGGVEGLGFSVDTVMFDTIFTSIGSTTRHFLVYNNSDRDMLIEGIRLAGGENSPFRVNVSGRPGSSFSEVPLRSRDSLYVFVEVTIDPTVQGTPFLVSDSIIFITRERVQSIKLAAYGQNVTVLRREMLKNHLFTADKPYLVYDWVAVDSFSTLTIEPGTRLHFQPGAHMRVHGTLVVNGTLEKPVVFSGARLEQWYADKPGQWGYISLEPGSSGHSINHAVIRNGTIGLVVDSAGLDGANPITISNTRVMHKARQGLLARASAITAYNSLFVDCGQAAVAITLGGDYRFYHCTIANFYRWAFRSTPALVISNYEVSGTGAIITGDLVNAVFSNSIVHGQLANEVALDFQQPGENQPGMVVNYRFSHALLRVTPGNTMLQDTTRFRNVIVNSSPVFISPLEGDFSLDSLSVAVDAGDVGTARLFPFDISGNDRLADGLPDLGFLELANPQ